VIGTRSSLEVVLLKSSKCINKSNIVKSVEKIYLHKACIK
jgi:hypothetical protein